MNNKQLYCGSLAQFMRYSSCFFFLTFVGLTTQSQAQIVPDATLPVNSTVIQQGNISIINGGTRAGTNLFHSFQQFSIFTGHTANFNNALDIQNIFSRITGSSISNIDGLIQANGTANLFLINPNGIIFGPNASLNIGGSFLATTANSIKFADEREFSATNPLATPLLTVNVPVGLQMGQNPGKILVQGSGHNLYFDNERSLGENRPAGLQLQDKTLALVGGEIELIGGNIGTIGGRIELGSVADNSRVSLTPTGNGWTLGYSEVGAFQDIQLKASSSLDASGSGGGAIQLQGRSIFLTEGSVILASTFGNQQGKNVVLRASENVELSGVNSRSFVATIVESEATGNAGHITVETGRLSLFDGAGIYSSTIGQGNGGNLTVRATESVTLSGYAYTGASYLSEIVGSSAMGNAGNLTIETGRLTLSDGAVISTSTFGQGNAGDLTVRATESVTLSGLDNSRMASSLNTAVRNVAIGNAGNITLETGRLTLSDGAFISSSTENIGNAGNVTVRATESVTLSGLNSDERGSRLETFVDTRGIGNAGNITLETGQLTLSDGAIISAAIYGEGQGGNLTVRATESVTLSGLDGSGSPSFLLIEVGSSFVGIPGIGDAGNITVETGQLTLSDGAVISASTFGQGNAGNLRVRATESITLSGLNGSGLGSALGTEVGGIGDGGNLSVETGRLTLSDGAAISASTLGEGNAGNLEIRATESVSLNGLNSYGMGSSLQTFVDSEATGKGGNLLVETGRLTLANRAVISSETFGRGNAGDLTLTAGQLTVSDGSRISVSGQGEFSPGTLSVMADRFLLDNQASLIAATESGSQGNINLSANSLILRRNSSITTNATGTAIGGNITLNTGTLAALENSDISANSQQAQGGNVTINAQATFGSVFRSREELERLLNTTDPRLLEPFRLPSSDITATGANSSLSGTVTITTPDIDPTSGLLQLPETPVDVTRLVTSTCRRDQQQSEFTVTGRGGLPPNPYEAIAEEATWIDLRPAAEERTNSATVEPTRIARTTQSSIVPTSQLIEAQGWVINSQGQVELVAQVPAANLQSPQFIPQQCYEQ